MHTPCQLLANLSLCVDQASANEPARAAVEQITAMETFRDLTAAKWLRSAVLDAGPSILRPDEWDGPAAGGMLLIITAILSASQPPVVANLAGALILVFLPLSANRLGAIISTGA